MKCARCGGHATREQDRRGRYVSCLICGAEVQLDQNGKPTDPMALTEEDLGPRKPGAYSRLWRNPRQSRKRP